MLIVFLLANAIAAIQAYTFTHFSSTKAPKTKSSDTLSFKEKIKILFTGVSNPRPENKEFPSQKFETVKVQSNKTIECWYLKHPTAKATVIICHGYSGSKSTMLDKANELYGMGFSLLLVDFMGSGGSEGNQTTIGYKEAEEVKTCFDYLHKRGDSTIFLYGTSMGAVAILKAMCDYPLNPTGIIIECPFGSMYQTVCNRFKTSGIPTFPLAGILTFWGGVENGFWAFSYKPSEYAKVVHCPTLLMYGGKDQKVTREETNEIYNNLGGKKQLIVFPDAGHENYLTKYKDAWSDSIRSFTYRYLPIDIEAKTAHDTSDLSYYKPLWGYRFFITGNFSGTGKIDTLLEHYYSQLTHKETNKFFEGIEYDDMVGLAVKQKPWSFMMSTNKKIDTLQITKENSQNFGIEWIKNEGDLLGDGKDEISYVVNWADWSSINTCHIVTYTKGGWKEIFSFMVHDWEIPPLPDYQTEYGLFGAAGGHSTNQNDTANQRMLSDLKKFSGFVQRVAPGVIQVHTWTIDANDTMLKVDLIHHTPIDSSINANYPAN